MGTCNRLGKALFLILNITEKYFFPVSYPYIEFFAVYIWFFIVTKLFKKINLLDIWQNRHLENVFKLCQSGIFKNYEILNLNRFLNFGDLNYL